MSLPLPGNRSKEAAAATETTGSERPRFGPILPVLTYERPEEVYSAVERGGKPLAVYVFSDREPFIDDVLRSTQSGGVTVNGVLRHAAERRLPFGGVNQSGMGRYHGEHGFREMSNARSIFVQR